MNVRLALRRRATTNMRAGDSVSQNRRAMIDPACAAVTVTIPIRTWNESNMHDHWRNRKRRVLTQRLATRVAFNTTSLPPLPVVMKFTRLAPHSLDEGDGLPTAFKAVRDEIADLYGVDDRDKRYRWEYAQERSKTYGVRVEIRAVQP